jgi:hypothetical protein
LRTGDLVEHLPSSSESPVLVAIYRDWGHTPDFHIGLIVDTKNEFALVMPCTCKLEGDKNKPRWYQDIELRIVHEAG